jgi:hypothetical protein
LVVSGRIDESSAYRRALDESEIGGAYTVDSGPDDHRSWITGPAREGRSLRRRDDPDLIRFLPSPTSRTFHSNER